MCWHCTFSPCEKFTWNLELQIEIENPNRKSKIKIEIVNGIENELKSEIKIKNEIENWKWIMSSS